MGLKQVIDVIYALISLFIVLPMWFYLIFKILEYVNASESMWLIFWIYIPVNILISILNVITRGLTKD